MTITKDQSYFFEIEEEICIAGSHYQILDELGAGGNSVVYECINNQAESFAIKFQLNLGVKSKKRFEQEIKLMKETSHPHLIKYFGDGEIDAIQLEKNGKGKNVRIPVLIMEKADKNLKEYLAERGELMHAEYIHQFLGLSEALGQIHKYAIHRDIKLENVLIIGDRWVLSDFGLCSFIAEEEHEDLTRVNEKVGPKYWMSPEAINKLYLETEEIKESSDVFQLVAVFWYVGTGRYPLGIVTLEDWHNDDKTICNTLLKGLSHNSDKRPKDGSELYAELKFAEKEYVD